jgi:hypothetical protein
MRHRNDQISCSNVDDNNLYVAGSSKQKPLSTLSFFY